MGTSLDHADASVRACRPSLMACDVDGHGFKVLEQARIGVAIIADRRAPVAVREACKFNRETQGELAAAQAAYRPPVGGQ